MIPNSLTDRCKPIDGQPVIWIWERAGQVTAGDYSEGCVRDASKSYQIIDEGNLPSHWIYWPFQFINIH